MLAAHQVAGIEIAPTQVWQRPLNASRREVLDYRQFWASRGIRIVALQSLLAGRPDLELDPDNGPSEPTFDYLADMIRLGSQLGVEVLVLDAPQDHRSGSCSLLGHRMAVKYFRRLGQLAEDYGVWLCIDPCPTSSGRDVVWTMAEGLALIKDVAQPGFGLHVNSMALLEAGDHAADVLHSAGNWWRHFHLQGLESTESRTRISRLIAEADYQGWLTLQMPATSIGEIESAIETCRRGYLTRPSFRRAAG